MFWLAAAALVALALGFVLWPLLRSRPAAEAATDRAAMMRALYTDRLSELEAESAVGQLDPEIRGAVVDELGANLLEEFASEERAPRREAGRAQGARMAVWLMLVLVPLAAIGVYFSAGEPAALELAGATEVMRLDPEADRGGLEMWSARLARRVAQRPDDGQSWYLLGVSRLQLGAFQAASEAFAHAHRQMGSDPHLSLYWLQARYFAAGGELDLHSRALARQVLEARPNHPLVLEMFAIDAYRRGDFEAAVLHLNRALDNPLNPTQRAALSSGLAQARSRMGTLTPTIDVEIDVPAEAPSRATLFVIARPPGGGMPYAVVRRPATASPLSVRLDDTVSMAGRKLSAAEQVQVVVRLSASGNPTPAPDDWEWQSDVLRLAGTDDAARPPLTLKAALAPRDAAGS